MNAFDWDLVITDAALRFLSPSSVPARARATKMDARSQGGMEGA